MQNHTEQEIELTIEQARECRDLGKMCRELVEDPKFTKLIDEGYFRDEAARLAAISTDANFQDEESKFDINSRIRAIGYLRDYLSKVMQVGNMAEGTIIEGEEALDEMRNEEEA